MDKSFQRLRRVLATIGGALVGVLFSAIWLLLLVGFSWLLLVPPLIGAIVGFVAGDRGIHALIRGTTLG